jgi:hypothetical protein
VSVVEDESDLEMLSAGSSGEICATATSGAG